MIDPSIKDVLLEITDQSSYSGLDGMLLYNMIFYMISVKLVTHSSLGSGMGPFVRTVNVREWQPDTIQHTDPESHGFQTMRKQI